MFLPALLGLGSVNSQNEQWWVVSKADDPAVGARGRSGMSAFLAFGLRGPQDPRHYTKGTRRHAASPFFTSLMLTDPLVLDAIEPVTTCLATSVQARGSTGNSPR
jgi:hypothetical protein